MKEKLDIAVGVSARSRVWKNKKMLWPTFVERLRKTTFTNETHKEFTSFSKDDQLSIKDVGGYVGGYLRNGRRKPGNVMHRRILTLDLDFATLDFWDLFCLLFENAAVIHSTHKHSDETPRYRLIIPLNRSVIAEEYTAIARKIAGDLNIELFDNTTFELNRLMFWPSTPADKEYYFEEQEGPWLDADEILNSYVDWRDITCWPTADKRINEIKNTALKQADPDQKKGLIGAFCRAHSIEDAIETFLQDAYVRVEEGRYTYLKGTTAGGLVIYENKFSFSHHSTDPTNGMLCNAFDLVRLHKFGHLDTGNTSDVTKIKSFKLMESFVMEDEKTKKAIAEETIKGAKYSFREPEDTEESLEQMDLEWAKDLEVDGRGKYTSTAPNINLIIANDIKLKGAFKHNNFDNKRYAFRSLPWRNGITAPETIKNVDYSGVRNYIESIYQITGNLKIDDSLALEFERHAFHPVRDYLESLRWDGTKRIDTLLIDCFGAVDNVYTREAIRKVLVGAVARIFDPGCKFDYVLTIVSKEGTGKSTFVKKLGKDWSSDTFLTVTGKEALEQIQGAWIIEMAELAGLKKGDLESTKHFITKQIDSFRPAYGRVSETYKRQCIFIGTTNDDDFLKGATGNRRFLPIDVRARHVTVDVFSSDFDDSIDQIWAEAVTLYRSCETVFLSPTAEKIANDERYSHTETDERSGIIEDFLAKLLPDNWLKKTREERVLFFEMGEVLEVGSSRNFVCVAEIWCECLLKDRNDMSKYNTRDINNIMRSLPGWRYKTTTKNFGPYGKQKYYELKNREI